MRIKYFGNMKDDNGYIRKNTRIGVIYYKDNEMTKFSYILEKLNEEGYKSTFCTDNGDGLNEDWFCVEDREDFDNLKDIYLEAKSEYKSEVAEQPEVPVAEQSEDASEPETAETTPEQPEAPKPEHFANVRFADNTHKLWFLEVLWCMGLDSDDLYHVSLAYLITLDCVCREHIDNIYDFNERCIKPECIYESWQTTTSRLTTFLAFNLFTSHSEWCSDNLKDLLTPDCIFCCEYAPYYFEAIKIRYPMFFETAETTPEQPEAPAPEQSEDESETDYCRGIDYSEIPFDLRIKDLCYKCKHLKTCFKNDRSKVLEDIHFPGRCGYNTFGELGECGEGCSLCCKQFESAFEREAIAPAVELSDEELEALLDDDEMPF